MNEIDIKKAFVMKNPGIAKKIPGFIFKLVERIIRQKEMNHVIRTYANANAIQFLEGTLSVMGVNIVVEGEENFPENGRCLFVSNHPLGGLDGLAIIGAINKKYGKVKALVNDLLFFIENLRPLFLPINKHGAMSKQNANLIDEAYSSDLPIFTFPAGLVSRSIKGRITDLEWKKNFIGKSIQYQRDIVPIYTLARNTKRFYWIGKIRKMLGIKTNIEMFLLPDEMFRQKNKTIVIRIGKPISYTFFNQSKSHTEWANYVKDQVYSMSSAAPAKTWNF